jgi:cholesterol transport system auxiliary component
VKIIILLLSFFPLSLRERVGVRVNNKSSPHPNPLPQGARGQRQTITITSMLISAFALTGCVGKILESKVDEPQLYVLHTGDISAATVAYPVQLGIALPAAAPGLDTNRIALLRNTNQLDYYFGARWGGTAPHVVQTFLIDTLQSQQGFRSVAAETARIDTDYLLELQLKDFQAEYASDQANPVVRITLGGNLISIKTRKLVTAVNARATVTASDNRLGAVVTAFQTAMQQVSSEVSTQLAAATAK